jgi:hypothetical protein
MLCPPAWAVGLRDKLVAAGARAGVEGVEVVEVVEVVEGAAHSELDPGMAAAMDRAVRAILASV